MGNGNAGITGWSAYVPRMRLTGEVTAQTWGGGRGGRALAYHDEDPITMSVEALLALEESGCDPTQLGLLYFASVSAPYAEHQNASIIRVAADLPESLQAADFGGTLRCGTQGLRAALDAVSAGRVEHGIVCTADVRLAPAGAPEELQYGDAAAVLAVGSDEVLAEELAYATFSEDLMETWRLNTDRFCSTGDPQYVAQYGVAAQAKRVWAMLKDRGVGEIDRVYIAAHNSRQHKAAVKALGLSDNQVVAPPAIGDTGSANALLGLIAALESAQPSETIAVINAAEGADLFVLRTTDRIKEFKPARPLATQLDAGVPWPNYGAYLRARGLVEGERLAPFTSPIIVHREEAGLLGRHGSVCEACGALNYPPRRICRECSAKDRMKPRKLARRGKVFTFTRDHLYPTPLPPATMLTVDLDGGGRFYAQQTDHDPTTEEIKIGDTVELTLRRIHQGGGFVNYFWKLRQLG